MSILNPCTACRRHLRVSDSTCPFCGAAIRSASTHAPAPLVVACALALLTVACQTSEDGESDDAQETTSSTNETSTSETSTSETSTSETSTETSTSETSTESNGTETDTTTTDSGGGSFYAGPDPDLPPDGAFEDLDDREVDPNLPRHGARYRLRE